MTREEVIKALDGCVHGRRTPCKDKGCPYFEDGDCRMNVMADALQLLEQDLEKELSAPTETVVKYKIINREDILSEFHELIFSHVNYFMDAKDENSKSDALSMIIGAAILTHNLLNPKIKEEMPNA